MCILVQPPECKAIESDIICKKADDSEDIFHHKVSVHQVSVVKIWGLQSQITINPNMF